MSEFWKRTLSGAVYVGVVAGSILWRGEAFAVLSAILAVMAVREYNRLTHPHYWGDVCSEIAAVLLCIAVYSPGVYGTSSAGLYIITVGAVLIGELWNKDDHPVSNWGNLLVSQVMVALPFALMNVLNGLSHWLLLAVFVLIWVNDSGAYCVGSMTAKRQGGNHKMFPRVSPKKSWEGLAGGVALAVGAGILLAHFGWFDECGGQMNRYITGILFALVVALSGTLGDLMESLLKRSVGVKDSGKFLPGHGGVLDRFDSILLAAPSVLLFLTVLANCR